MDIDIAAIVRIQQPNGTLIAFIFSISSIKVQAKISREYGFNQRVSKVPIIESVGNIAATSSPLHTGIISKSSEG